MTERELMTRARRLAASSPVGPELLDFLRRPEIVAKLRATAAKGTPPAAAVSADLLANFPSAIRDPALKRKVGVFIAGVLDEHGFDVARPNVRMKDPLFTTGAVYKLRAQEAAPVDLVSRFAAALTEEEAEQMLERLLKRFPALRKLHR